MSPSAPPPMRDERLRALDAQAGELARRVLDDAQPLGRLALREHDPLDRPAALAQARLDRCARTASQAPGSLTTIARRASSASSSAASAPTAMPSPSTIRPIGVSARRRVVPADPRASERPASRVVDRIDDALDLGDPGLVDLGRGVEPGTPRGEVADRADRVPTGDQRPDVRRSGAGAGPGPRDARRARPWPGLGRATSGCGDRRPRPRRSRSPAGSPGPDRPGRARRSPRARAPRNAASPSSAKMSGIDRPVDRSICSSRSMKLAPCRWASRRPMTLLPLPGSPTSTTSMGGQSSPPEPASSVPVRPCLGRRLQRRPPATGASGVAAIRSR